MIPKRTALSGLLLAALLSLGCNCKWFETTAQLQGLFDESDVVFVGRVVGFVGRSWPGRHGRLRGTSVLLKALKPQKGVARGDTVLVLQAGNNCDKRFGRKETAIVFGRAFRRVGLTAAHNSLSEAGWQEDGQALQVSRPDSGYFRTYHRLLGRYHGVSTNQCVTFSTRERLPAAFIRAKSRR